MSFSKCEQTSRRCFKERGMIEKFNFWHKKKDWKKKKKKVGLESLQPISICACVRARAMTLERRLTVRVQAAE